MMAAWAQKTPQTTTAKQTRPRAWWMMPSQVCLILSPVGAQRQQPGAPLGQGLLEQ